MFNHLMRTILGYRPSQHVKIADMYRLTTFIPLCARRQTALVKFIRDVKNEQQFSVIRSCLVNRLHPYATRGREHYVIPNTLTTWGLRRISVRGLKLHNAELATA